MLLRFECLCVCNSGCKKKEKKKNTTQTNHLFTSCSSTTEGHPAGDARAGYDCSVAAIPLRLGQWGLHKGYWWVRCESKASKETTAPLTLQGGCREAVGRTETMLMVVMKCFRGAWFSLQNAALSQNILIPVLALSTWGWHHWCQCKKLPLKRTGLVYVLIFRSTVVL